MPDAGHSRRQTGFLHDVRVDHRRLNVLVAEQLLHRPHIVTVLQQVCGEAVPQRMAGDPLVAGK